MGQLLRCFRCFYCFELSKDITLCDIPNAFYVKDFSHVFRIFRPLPSWCSEIHFMTHRNRLAEVCRLILDLAPPNGASANAMNRISATALHIAARGGHTAACRALTPDPLHAAPCSLCASSCLLYGGTLLFVSLATFGTVQQCFRREPGPRKSASVPRGSLFGFMKAYVGIRCWPH